MTDVHTDSPLVTVLLLCYNQERYIEEALVSALEQDYANLQVVVTDDASKDATQQVLREIAKNYSADRLKVIFNPLNVGVTKNCNAGLLHCKGELIAFIGGDDVFMPSKVSRQVAWFKENPDMVLCGHDVELIDEEGNEIKSRFGKMGEFSSGKGAGGIIRAGTPFASVSVMLKRNRIPPYGFHPAIPMVSDWKFWIDVVGIDGCYGHVEGKWAKYRRHSANVTAHMNSKIMRDVLMTAVLSLWHLRGRYFKDWVHYFFVRPILKRVRRKVHD
ncbi:MAG: glycosyltransferase [Sideroxydans sp.]